MTGFEKYLMFVGFIKHRFDYKSEQWIITDSDSISSMVDLDYLYIHPDGRKIKFGLNERDAPPCIKHPRPKVIDGEYAVSGRDQDMIRLLDINGNEKTLELIFDKNFYIERI